MTQEISSISLSRSTQMTCSMPQLWKNWPIHKDWHDKIKATRMLCIFTKYLVISSLLSISPSNFSFSMIKKSFSPFSDEAFLMPCPEKWKTHGLIWRIPSRLNEVAKIFLYLTFFLIDFIVFMILRNSSLWSISPKVIVFPSSIASSTTNFLAGTTFLTFLI